MVAITTARKPCDAKAVEAVLETDLARPPVGRTRALVDAVLAITSATALPDVLDRLVAHAAALTHATHATLCVPGEAGALTEVASSDPGQERARARMWLPVLVRGELFGHIALGPKSGGTPFTGEDRAALSALADAAGVAIDNARAHDRAGRREQWLHATTEVMSVLRTGRDESLDVFVRRTREVAGAVMVTLAMPVDPENLAFRAADGPNTADLPGVRMPVVDSLTGDVFSTARPRRVDTLAEAALSRSVASASRLPDGLDELGSAIFVPLSTGRHPVGVLIVAKAVGEAPFDDDDLDSICRYAGHAALAIDFARAQQDRQRLALFEERDRIARDLHDLVIQRLFALGLGLRRAGRAAGGEVDGQLQGYVAEIDQTIREIRRTIFSLQEPESGPYSLRGEILRAISDATASLGFEPTVRLEGPLDSVVPFNVQFDLIATLREALSNVVRHAEASGVQVTVTVDRCATGLELLVRDDGKGLPTGIGHRSGLSNMAQRAEHNQGECHIERADSGGTRVDWRVPLAKRTENR